MASTLTSRSLIRQRLSLCPSRSPLSLQSIRRSHQGHADSLGGLIKLSGYRKIPFPSLAKKRICLWNGKQKVGVMAMPDVMRDFLGPGKVLSWRPDTEVLRRLELDRESPGTVDGKGKTSLKPGTGILDYEVMTISEPRYKLNTFVRRLIRRENGIHQVQFRSNTSLYSPPTRSGLGSAYHLLGSPEDGARHPVKFRIALPRVRNSPYKLKWAVNNRVDLHPEVIMQAMPHGVRCTTVPHIHMDGSNVIWSCVAQHYDPSLLQSGKAAEHSDPEAEARAARNKHRLSDNPSPELQAKFERAVKKAQRNQEATIRAEYEKILSAAVQRRWNKFNGGPIAPLPEERAKMQKRMKAAIERAMPKVRAAVEHDFGVKPKATAAVEDESEDGSGGTPSSPTTNGSSS